MAGAIAALPLRTSSSASPPSARACTSTNPPWGSASMALSSSSKIAVRKSAPSPATGSAAGASHENVTTPDPARARASVSHKAIVSRAAAARSTMAPSGKRAASCRRKSRSRSATRLRTCVRPAILAARSRTLAESSACFSSTKARFAMGPSTLRMSCNTPAATRPAAARRCSRTVMPEVIGPSSRLVICSARPPPAGPLLRAAHRAGT